MIGLASVSATMNNRGVTGFLKVTLATHLPRMGVAVPSQLASVTNVGFSLGLL